MSELVRIERLPDNSPLPIIILGKTAYPFMLIVTGILCSMYESLQNVIPGHPILSFLVLACGAMVLTFLIMRLALIGAAFSALCCMFILCVVFQIIMNAIKPDSVQYFILLTVIFSVICLTLCYFNLAWDSGCIYISGLSCIVAGILNTLSAAFYILIIRGIWEEYCIPNGGIVIEDKILYDSIVGDIVGAPRGFASVPGAVVFYIVFAVICIGVFVATVVFRDTIARINTAGVLSSIYDN